MLKGRRQPGLTGGHDAFVGGDDVALRRAGSDHHVVRLGALQAPHGELAAGDVGLQHQGVVVQTRHRHLEIDKDLGVGVGPAQFHAASRHIGDVQWLCVCVVKKRRKTTTIFPNNIACTRFLSTCHFGGQV